MSSIVHEVNTLRRIVGTSGDRTKIDTFFYYWWLRPSMEKPKGFLESPEKLVSHIDTDLSKHDTNKSVQEYVYLMYAVFDDEEADLFVSFLGWYARTLEVIGRRDLAIHALLQHGPLLGTAKGASCYQLVRLLVPMPEGEIWRIVRKELVSWGGNWEYAAQHDDFQQVIWLLGAMAIQEASPAIAFLLKSDTLGETGRLDGCIGQKIDRPKEQIEWKIGTMSLKAELMRKIYNDTDNFYWRWIMSSPTQRKAALRVIEECEDAPLLQKLRKMTQDSETDYLALLQAEPIAAEAERWFEQQYDVFSGYINGRGKRN